MLQISLTRLRLIVALVLTAALVDPGRSLAESGHRLTGAAISQLVNGKQIIFRGSRHIVRGTAQNPEISIRTDGVVTDITLVFREDRSYRRLCMFRAPNGSTGTCGGPYQGTGTGIWRVNGDTLCLGEVVVPGRETCYEIERAGANYRCRYASGGLAAGAIRGGYDGLEFELIP